MRALSQILIVLLCVFLETSVHAAAGSALPAPNIAVASSILGLAHQPDGAVVLVGTFSTVGGVYRPGVARILAGGTLDPAFTPTPSTAYLFNSAIQPDGRILLAGFFSSMNGVARNGMARVNADGTLDSALDPSFNSFVRTTLVQTNGQIVCSGNFSTVQPNGGAVVNRLCMARFNANGTLDATFDPGVDSGPQCILQQADGKLLVCGDFSSFAPNGGLRVYNLGGVRRLNTDGTIDATFTPPTFNGLVSTLALDASGKILAGGSFIPHQTQPRHFLTRLNADGTLDSSFNASLVGTGITSIAVQANGQIILGGIFSSVGGVPRSNLARVNTSGAVDASFIPNPNGSAYVTLMGNGQIYVAGEFGTIAGSSRANLARLENDLPTETLSVTSSSRVQWLRGGTLPEVQGVTFELSTNGGTSWTPLGVGTRMAGGWERTGLSLPGSGQVRATVQTAGSYNNGSSGIIRTVEPFPFVAPSLVVEHPTSTALVSGTSSVACGSILVNGTSAPFVFTVKNTAAGELKRLLVAVDGTHAHDFVLTQMPVTSLANSSSTTFSVVFSPRGLGSRTATLRIGSNSVATPSFNIALTGTGLPSTNANLATLTTSVKPVSPAFNSATLSYTMSVPFGTTSLSVTPTVAQADATLRLNSAVVPSGVASAPIALNAGSNVITMEVTAQDGVTIKTYTLTVTRAAAVVAGDIDQTFTHFVNGTVSATVFQPDGKMIVVGLLQGINGNFSTHYGIIRFNLDGSVDTGFDPQTFGDVNAIVVLPNGQIVIAGSFTSVNPNGSGAVNRNNIARLNADGTLDASFDPNIPGGGAFSLSLEPDGDILVAGSFSAFQPNGAAAPTTRNNIARIRPDGTLDTSFNPNANAAVYHVNVLPSGLMMVGGDFTTIGGGSRSRVARLRANGTLDPTFDYAVDATVFSTLVQPDGNILVSSNRPNGSASPRLARVSTTGTVDSTFDPQISSGVRTMALQTNGQLVIGGVFTAAGFTPRLRVARLNADGSVDAGFDPQVEGSGAAVHSLMIREDGKIMMGGYFATVGSLPRQSLARLENLTAATQSITMLGFDGFAWRRGGSAPEATSTTFEVSTDGGTNWTLLGPGIRNASGWEIAGLSGLPVSGLVRARGVVVGGRFGGSSWLVSSQASFQIPAAKIDVEQPVNTDLEDGDTINLGTLGLNVLVPTVITIRNAGGQNLMLGTVTIDGTNKNQFSIIDQPAPTVAPLESTTFTVQAKVTSAGAKTATLNIPSNDTTATPFNIVVNATGVPALLPVATTVAATGLDFNGTAVNAMRATLNGTVDANGQPREVSFEYGPTTAYGTTITLPGTFNGANPEPVTTQLTGLAPHTTYNFRVRIDGDLGNAVGSNRTFTTVNRAPVAGDDTASALASAATTIAVLDDDTDADGDTLSISTRTAVTPSTAGTVAIVGKNLVFTASAAFGTAPNATASFGYRVSDGEGGTDDGTVIVSSGSASLDLLTKNVTSEGTAFETPSSYPVGIQTEGSWAVTESLTWATVSPLSGRGNGTVNITVQPNTTTASRTGIIRIGGVAHTITQTGTLKPTLGPLTGSSFNAIVGGAFELVIPTVNAPVTYTVTGMPPGLSLSNSTGIITGRPTMTGTTPTNYNVTVRASNSAGPATSDTAGRAAALLTFTINVIPLPAGAVGTFHGLIERNSSVNVSSIPNLGARWDMTVSALGAISGKIVEGVTSRRFTSKLEVTPDTANAPTVTAAITGTTLTLDLKLDAATDSLSTGVGENVLRSAGDSSVVTGWGNAWSTSAPIKRATQFRGPYSFAITNPATTTATNTVTPDGHGFGSFIVSETTGTLRITGDLPDGSKILSDSFIGQNGEVLLYTPLHGNRGSIHGKLTVTAQNAPTDNRVEGSLTWLKPTLRPADKDKSYQGGFGPITLDADGSTYLPPARGLRVLGLPAPALTPTTATNAKLAFTLGGLDLATPNSLAFNQFIRVNNPSPTGLTNTATVVPFNATTLTNPNRVAITTFTAPTGAFAGSFTLPGTPARVGPFAGQIVRIIGANTTTQGYGYFLLPTVPNVTTSPKYSGRVELSPP